ncbi:hypothetical protein VTK26DRAFT_6971 [Humicola hyalothermophila]
MRQNIGISERRRRSELPRRRTRTRKVSRSAKPGRYMLTVGKEAQAGRCRLVRRGRGRDPAPRQHTESLRHPGNSVQTYSRTGNYVNPSEHRRRATTSTHLLDKSHCHKKPITNATLQTRTHTLLLLSFVSLVDAPQWRTLFFKNGVHELGGAAMAQFDETG